MKEFQSDNYFALCVSLSLSLSALPTAILPLNYAPALLGYYIQQQQQQKPK